MTIPTLRCSSPPRGLLALPTTPGDEPRPASRIMNQALRRALHLGMLGVLLGLGLHAPATGLAQTGGTPAPAPAPLSALPPEELAALRAVKPDPPPEALTQDTHFVVSDELRHDLYYNDVKDVGGVYLGVGTDQNYTIASYVRPELMILLDFDQVVVDLHRAYRVMFLNAATPDEFVKLWSQASMDQATALIKAAYPDNKAWRLGAVRAFRDSRHRVYKRMGVIRKLFTDVKLPHFLLSQEVYTYLRKLFEHDRVLMVRGDLTATTTMRGLAAVLKAHGRVLRVAYISNCEQYFKFEKDYRANMEAMPTDERSFVLRSRAWREWCREAECPLHYLHISQRYDNFRQWLAAPHIRDMRQMVPYEALKVGVRYYAITKPPPPKPTRKKSK